MAARKPYNFAATLAFYMVAGLIVAGVLRFLVHGSPKYHWLFPQATARPQSSPTAAGR